MCVCESARESVCEQDTLRKMPPKVSREAGPSQGSYKTGPHNVRVESKKVHLGDALRDRVSERETRSLTRERDPRLTITLTINDTRSISSSGGEDCMAISTSSKGAANVAVSSKEPGWYLSNHLRLGRTRVSECGLLVPQQSPRRRRLQVIGTSAIVEQVIGTGYWYLSNHLRLGRNRVIHLVQRLHLQTR